MTFSELTKKILNRWWIVLLVTLLSVVLTFLFNFNQKNYVSNISVGLNLNSESVVDSNDVFLSSLKQTVQSNTFAEISKSLSLYLNGKFQSLSVQSKIAEKVGTKIDSSNEKKPFYNIQDQGLGYVSLTYYTNSKEEADKFIQAVQDVYKNEIIKEWNNQRSNTLTIRPNDFFIKSVNEYNLPIEIQILPVFASFILTLVLVVILPNKKPGD
jgi:capsular polysaccharide biosynthesis protein